VIKARAAMVMNHRGDGPSSTAAVYAALVWDILVALSKALAQNKKAAINDRDWVSARFDAPNRSESVLK
jgi:hypothetical protein